MNLYDFFTHPDMQLPSQWESSKDFEAYVSRRLDGFLTLIDKLDPNLVSDEVRRRKPAIISCCDELRLSLRSSFEGHSSNAYKHFDTAMQEILPEINTLAFDVNGPRDFGILYRVRQTLSPSLQAVDLFHVPFELRHLVSTQRYSIPGLPCLYLAGSLYTCWEEMGRPPFHELQCAALWVKHGKSLKVLNLSNRPVRLSLSVTAPGSIPHDHAFCCAQIVLWPLVFSSSIKVKHRNAPFKPEYVIPQMALQWICQNHGFDSLAYFSTHVQAISKTHPLPVCNLVVPAKKITPAGRCELLCDTFKMSDPLGWQMLSSVNVGKDYAGESIPNYDLDFIEGVDEPYAATEFGKVQTRLNKIVYRTLRKIDAGEAMLGDISPS